MSKIRVRKHGHDWMMTCHQHHGRQYKLYRDSQAAAYEAAVGHAMMHHPEAAALARLRLTMKGLRLAITEHA